MPELTPELLALGATGFSGDIPIGPDGTPVLRQNQPAPEPVPQGNPILEQIIAQQGLVGGEAPGGGPTAPDTVGYGFGPYYSASPQDYPDNRTPLAPPVWNLGMEGEPPPGALISDGGGIPIGWEQYRSKDTSTGGGFFTAEDLFGPGKVPYWFHEGASLPSTNNWRLLPGQYSSPRYIMRNGNIIDTQDPYLRGPGYRLNLQAGPNWALGPQGTNYPAAYSYGVNGPSYAGWPGQQSAWHSLGQED